VTNRPYEPVTKPVAFSPAKPVAGNSSFPGFHAVPNNTRQEKFVRFLAKGMVAAVAFQSEARPKNELVTFSGFGAPVTIGSETYPQVSITPGADTPSAIYIFTGDGSGMTFNSAPCVPPTLSRGDISGIRNLWMRATGRIRRVYAAVFPRPERSRFWAAVVRNFG
jgi:hypothetical protein